MWYHLVDLINYFYGFDDDGICVDGSLLISFIELLQRHLSCVHHQLQTTNSQFVQPNFDFFLIHKNGYHTSGIAPQLDVV